MCLLEVHENIGAVDYRRFQGRESSVILGTHRVRTFERNHRIVGVFDCDIRRTVKGTASNVVWLNFWTVPIERQDWNRWSIIVGEKKKHVHASGAENNRLAEIPGVSGARIGFQALS